MQWECMGKESDCDVHVNSTEQVTSTSEPALASHEQKRTTMEFVSGLGNRILVEDVSLSRSVTFRNLQYLGLCC